MVRAYRAQYIPESAPRMVRAYRAQYIPESAPRMVRANRSTCVGYPRKCPANGACQQKSVNEWCVRTVRKISAKVPRVWCVRPERGAKEALKIILIILKKVLKRTEDYSLNIFT